MKTAVVLLVVLVMLVGMVGPSEAWVRGGHFHGFRGGWWWPGAIVGGLALGAVAATYSYPYYYAPPPAYAAPPVVYQSAPTYVTQSAPAVQREVSYPNGRYVLYGDGVTQPWQWVWVPNAPPPPPPPPR